MPHANELQEQFGARGLQVIGVTGEPAQPTQTWIQDKGARYAYAYDPQRRLHQALGVRGIPHAVLLDPEGKLVWRGHPAALTDAIVEGALAGTLPAPLWAWPESLAEVRAALQAERLVDARRSAQALSDRGLAERLLPLIELRIEARLAALKALYDDLDLEQLERLLAALEAGLAGDPRSAALVELRRLLAEDPALPGARAALAELAAAEQRLSEHDSGAKALDLAAVQAAIERLAPISKQYGKQAPGRRARELGSRLKKLRKQLSQGD